MYTATATSTAKRFEAAEHAVHTRLVCFSIVYCLQIIPELLQILVLDLLLFLREPPVHYYHAVDSYEAHASTQGQCLQAIEFLRYFMIVGLLALSAQNVTSVILAGDLYIMTQHIDVLVHAHDGLGLVRPRYAHITKAKNVRVRFAAIWAW